MDASDCTGRANNRLIAIGDIHGCSAALKALIELVKPEPEDTLVTLGDYVDRGPDSKGVLDQLIDLKSRYRLVPLMGNHEEIMLGARQSPSRWDFWMTVGGDAALDSYGCGRRLELVPHRHWSFLEQLKLFYETDDHFFAHANYVADQALTEQRSETLLWLDLVDVPSPHYSGKVAVVGHTRQANGEIIDLGHLKCIDAGCGHGGCLTALDVKAGVIWQVDEEGRTRLTDRKAGAELSRNRLDPK